MKVLATKLSRQEYLDIQTVRSGSKFRFCKVSIHDVAKYRSIIERSLAIGSRAVDVGPILCLGSRNGREVDLFRVEFFGPRWRRMAARLFERHTHSFVPLLPLVESLGRSDVKNVTPDSVVGVEINPQAARSDIWIGSFDEMPGSWDRTFGVLFSNSFDQSLDPYKTAQEWKRVARPGGHLIFCFVKNNEPTITDPVGDLLLGDVLELFEGELVYFHDSGSRSRDRYSEVIIRFGDR